MKNSSSDCLLHILMCILLHVKFETFIESMHLVPNTNSGILDYKQRLPFSYKSGSHLWLRTGAKSEIDQMAAADKIITLIYRLSSL